MMKAAEFAARAVEKLGSEMLSRGGRVLYSQPISLDGPAVVYYLGINPRDAPSSSDPDHHSVRTIERDLAMFVQGRTPNSFLDEEWKGLAPGTAEVQQRVRTLAAWAGVGEDDFRRMPASNVVFPRTVEQPPAKQFKAWADVCWPVHEVVLEMTGAHRILVGGTRAGEAVVVALGGDPTRPAWRQRLDTANYSLSIYEIGNRVVFVLPPVPRWRGMETVDKDVTQDALARFGVGGPGQS